MRIIRQNVKDSVKQNNNKKKTIGKMSNTLSLNEEREVATVQDMVRPDEEIPKKRSSFFLPFHS